MIRSRWSPFRRRELRSSSLRLVERRKWVVQRTKIERSGIGVGETEREVKAMKIFLCLRFKISLLYKKVTSE